MDSILHQVPFSTGRLRPKLKVPQNVCDCHHHIYNPVEFPCDLMDERNQPPATVECYRLLQKRLGLTRNVIIQASAYGTDNSCLLNALNIMGTKNTKGIAVCRSDVQESDLEKMDHMGIKGLRVNLASQLKINTIDEIIPLSEKIDQFGWHMQFWINPNDIKELYPVLKKIKCDKVFDHRGHIPAEEGLNHPAFNILSTLLEDGKTWIKLSGLAHDTKVGAPTYSDTVLVGRSFVKLAPDRMLWGTDWPHPSSFTNLEKFPDDAHLLDLLAEQALTEENLYKILVTNPEKLYGFNEK